MRKTTMNINDYLLTSLRDGQSAEEIAKDLSSALQAAEKQLAEEKAAKEVEAKPAESAEEKPAESAEEKPTESAEEKPAQDTEAKTEEQ